MTDVLKCSSCRKNDIETVFKFDPNNKKHHTCSETGNRYQTNRIYKTCKQCRERKTKSRNLKKLNDTFIIPSEDALIITPESIDVMIPESVDALIISSDEVVDDDSFIVTKENRNIVLHKISNYLPEGETFKIEKSYNDDVFSFFLPSRHAMISICVGDTWKHIRKYIDKPRLNFDTCSICLLPQTENLITCNRCHADACVNCHIQILRKNKGKIVCAFCRNVVGVELPPHLIEVCVLNMLQTVKEENERLSNK
jgi:hypothetical protein